MGRLIELKLRIIKNRLRGLRNESIFKIVFVLFFAIFLLWGIYALSLKTFLLLENIEGLSRILIDRIIYLFFFSLSFMLVLSSAIWGYITLYKTQEINFLFSLPLEYSRLFSLKYLETVVLSGWAFLFLSFPFLSAYGFFRSLPWTFYLYIVLNIIPLAFLCSSLGLLFALIIVRYLPRNRRLVFGATVFFLFMGWQFFKIYSRDTSAGDESLSFFLTRVFPYIKLSQNKILPSFWISEALMDFSFRRYREGLFWWGMVMSNTAFLTLLCFDVADRVFYPAWERLASLSHRKMIILRPVQAALLKKLLRLQSPSPLNAILTKDIILLRRSPEQNLQFLFFFGLLGLYFSNLRNLSYHSFIPRWKAIVLLLNITATQLSLGSFVIRFIFPQISLEGNKFWLLGLSPLKREVILWEKFFFFWLISLGITLGLTLISNFTLKVDHLYIWISLLVTIISSLTITAISCGLGAVFANFKEDNPAVIVSGFGGTFTLVLTLFYIAALIFLISPPFYLYLAGSAPWTLFKKKLIFSGLLFVVFSFLISFACLFWGKRRLRNAEF